MVVGCVLVTGSGGGAGCTALGGKITESFISHPSGCRYPDSRPLFCVAVHDAINDDTFIDVSVGACACLPPSVDEGSTHVSVCEARTVQLVNANRSSYAIVGFEATVRGRS